MSKTLTRAQRERMIARYRALRGAGKWAAAWAYERKMAEKGLTNAS